MLFSSGQRASQVGRDRALAFLRNRARNQDLLQRPVLPKSAANEPPGTGTSRPPGFPLRRPTPTGCWVVWKPAETETAPGSSRSPGDRVLAIVVLAIETRRTRPAPLALRGLEQFGRDTEGGDSVRDGSVPARSASDLCNASNIWLMIYMLTVSVTRTRRLHGWLVPAPALARPAGGRKVQASVLAAFCTSSSSRRFLSFCRVV